MVAWQPFMAGSWYCSRLAGSGGASRREKTTFVSHPHEVVRHRRARGALAGRQRIGVSGAKPSADSAPMVAVHLGWP